MSAKNPTWPELIQRTLDCARDYLDCFDVWSSLKTPAFQIHVAGLFQPLGAPTEAIEVVTVDLALPLERIDVNLGRARVHGEYVDRCYLARPVARDADCFDPSERNLATDLGVGLLELDAERASEVVPARRMSPSPERRAEVLSAMQVFTCTICRSLHRMTDHDTDFGFVAGRHGPRGILSAATHRQAFAYRLERFSRKLDFTPHALEMARARYVCVDCTEQLFGIVAQHLPADDSEREP